MVGHGGSSAGSYLADPTSPIPSHCASIVTTSTLRVIRTVLCKDISSLIRINAVTWAFCSSTCSSINTSNVDVYVCRLESLQQQPSRGVVQALSFLPTWHILGYINTEIGNGTILELIWVCKSNILT